MEAEARRWGHREAERVRGSSGSSASLWRSTASPGSWRSAAASASERRRLRAARSPASPDGARPAGGGAGAGIGPAARMSAAGRGGAVSGGVVPWSGPTIVRGLRAAWWGAHPTHLAMAAKRCLPLVAFPDAPRRYGGSQRGRQRQPLSASLAETALPTETCVAATEATDSAIAETPLLLAWVSDTSCREGYPARVSDRHRLSDRSMPAGDRKVHAG